MNLTKQALRAGLPEEGVVLMSRCAKNRALYELPEEPPGERRKRPGPRRKYGDRARRPEDWLAQRSGWRQARLSVRGRTIRPRYRVEGPYVLKKAAERPVFLVVVKGVDRGRGGSGRRRRWRKPDFWMISVVLEESGRWTLPSPVEELLGWAWQRWEVEVCHREMKTGFGLGEAQCWGPRSAVMSVRWRAWAYGVLVLAGFRAWGLGAGPLRRPAGAMVGRGEKVVVGDVVAGLAGRGVGGAGI